MGRLDNRVAIVVGASRGIGKVIARVFAEEGARVLVVGVHDERGKKAVEEIRRNGGDASFLRGDVSRMSDMARVAESAVKLHGRIDILCQNAAAFSSVKLEKMTEDEWDAANAVNLRGTFLAVKACMPQMIKQRYGRILVTSSVTGPRVAMPGLAHYATTKAGINGFIRSAALELARYNITVNGVEPGNIATESLEDLQHDDGIKTLVRLNPMKRLGEPEDVAYAMLFLASDEAKYITGQTIVVDGGATLPESQLADF